MKGIKQINKEICPKFFSDDVIDIKNFDQN